MYVVKGGYTKEKETTMALALLAMFPLIGLGTLAFIITEALSMDNVIKQDN